MRNFSLVLYLLLVNSFRPCRLTFQNSVAFLSIIEELLTRALFVIVLLLYFSRITEFIGLGKWILVCPVK